jgi:hypothetical protein
MSVAQELKIKRLPALAPLLARAALPKRQSKALNFPERSIELAPVRYSQRQLKRYAKSCGFSLDGNTLPASFLHIMAFRLQMQLMIQRDFPVAAMGCVHLNNEIIQHRAISSSEALRMVCRLSDHELTARGVEFTFECLVYAGDECVWEDRSQYLSRRKTGIAKPAKSKPREARRYANQEAMHIPNSTARHYALASGDFNPIHLHDLSAKVLGFKKMVVHGMWSKAACMAKLIDGGDALRCRVEFKTPVFLPSKAELHYEKGPDSTVFELRDAASGKPHLIGELSPISA